MSTNFLEIRLALEVQLQALGLSNVVYENTELDLATLNKNANVEFYQAFLLPAETEALSAGPEGRDIHEGIFQVNYYCQVGKGGHTLRLDQIADQFKRGTSLVNGLTTVRVRNVSLGAGRREDAYFLRNVDISYYAVTAARS